jgi:hypothetical protein
LSWLLSWRPETLPDSWAPAHGWTLTRVLMAVAIVVCLAYAAVARPRIARHLTEKARRFARGLLLGLLAVAALLAVAVYLDFGVFRYGTFLNEWDFFHYYVGSKYAPELGYTKLYGATLLADRELGPRYHNPQNMIRDLSSAELRPTETAVAEAARYRGAFTDARWRDFVADIGWFREQLPAERWSLLLVDHGYNGTPAWSFLVGALFTRHLSVRAPAQKWVMLLLDPLLLVTAMTVVAWAFGARTAFFMVIFIGTHYLLSWGHLKGALLRTDFAMCSTIAVCLVKKGRYGLAGALLGWAISSRIFPAFFLAGPVALLAWGWLRERRLERSWLRLLLACAAIVALAVVGSCAYFGGIAIWRDWAQKITLHYVGGSDWDLGYRTVVESLFVHGVPVHAASLGQEVAQAGATAAWTVVAALVLVPAVSFLRALEDYQAVAYGFIFIYMLSLAAYYYYLVLAVPLLFFAPSLDKLQSALGVAFMFFTGYLGYLLFSGWQPLADFVAFRGWRQTFPTYYFLSCIIAVTVAQMIALAATRAKEKRKALPNPPPLTQLAPDSSDALSAQP